MPDDAERLRPLLRPEAAAALHDEGDGILSVLPPEGAASAGRFDGIYGPLYDRVIQSDALRRLAPLAYGDAGPVPDLDGFATKVALGAHASGPRPVLLDVPSGGGTLLPRLADGGFRGLVIEADLGSAMLRRAARQRRRTPNADVVLLRADAHDLPLRDGSVDAAVSLNGLHVMPDPRTFLRELGRLVKPGGRVWLVTLVSGGTRRADAVNRLGRVTGILPGPPPTRPTLLRWLREAGFGRIEPLGGTGLTALSAVRE